MRRLESPRWPARGPARLADPAAVLIAVSIIVLVTAFTAATCQAVPGDVIDSIGAPSSSSSRPE